MTCKNSGKSKSRCFKGLLVRLITYYYRYFEGGAGGGGRNVTLSLRHYKFKFYLHQKNLFVTFWGFFGLRSLRVAISNVVVVVVDVF